MNNTYRSNSKRIKDLLLSDTIEDDHVAGEDSDSDNDSDFVPVESDDTSTNEHISECIGCMTFLLALPFCYETSMSQSFSSHRAFLYCLYKKR